MGQLFPDITDTLKAFILKQKLFFVASAPLSRSGKVNVSPKGYDTLRILSATKLYYLDLTGSGVETVANMKENGRITLMWISFDKAPQIVRVWGQGRAVEAGTPEYEELVEPAHKALPGARAAIVVDVLMTGNSCGYSVPFFEFKAERTLLLDRAYKRVENVGNVDPHDIKYHTMANMWSLNDLVGLEHLLPKTAAWYVRRYALSILDRETLLWGAERVAWMALGAVAAVSIPTNSLFPTIIDNMSTLWDLLTLTNVFSALCILYVTRRLLFFYDNFVVSPLRVLPVEWKYWLFPPLGILLGLKGKGFLMLNEMHRRGGSVVRLGASVISVADPQIAHQILKIADFPKPKMVYERFKNFKSDPDNIFVTTSKPFHKRARRLVTPAFSIKYLNNLEPFMYPAWQTFENKVRSMPANGNGWVTVDVQDYFQNMAFDIIGETAFGASFGMVETGHHPLLAARRAIFRFAIMKLMFPILSFIDYRLLPIRKSVDLQRSSLEKVYTDRIALNGRGERRDDILQMLLDYRDPETGGKLTPPEIATTTSIFNAAGSETTANSMTWVTYFLVKYPSVMAKLQRELDAAFPDGLTEQLELAKLKSLPYLDAVIKEAMRMRPVAPGIAREAPEDTVFTVHGPDGNQSQVFLPAGTLIEVSFFSIHRSPQIWLRPDDFLPERWLEGSANTQDEEAWGVQAQHKDAIVDKSSATWGKPKMVNRDAFWPFSAGSRDCIGKNFALNEMRIILGHLVRRFDLVAGFDTGEEIEGATFITLSADKKGGLQVKLKPRKA
ncbi:hypothetical protein HDU93_007123, partial [Gonapodya sp. JEL0774]